MVRPSQGGSVLSFVIGGVFLAALLVGGIYWMSQQNQTRNTPLPTPPQAPQEVKPSDKPVAPEQQQPQPQASTGELPSNGPIHELPATGPREVFVASLAIALLSGVGISYMRSRRHAASL